MSDSGLHPIRTDIQVKGEARQMEEVTEETVTWHERAVRLSQELTEARREIDWLRERLMKTKVDRDDWKARMEAIRWGLRE